jgi:apolipoprotein N-acyltransferase
MGKKQAIQTVQPDRWSYLWLAIAALLSMFNSGKWALPVATWFVGVFLIRFMRTQPVWRGFLLAWLVVNVTSTITWWGIVPQPLTTHIITMAIGNVFACLPLLADRLLVRRLPGLAATLVYPVAQTAFEYLYVAASPQPSMNALAYSVHGSLALLQLVSVTGMWGVTFLVTWLAPVVNWAWERSFAWRQVWRGAALYGGILLVVLVYGSARLAFFVPQPGTVRVAAFTSVDMRAAISEVQEAARNDRAKFRQISAEHQDRYFRDSLREAGAGAKIVLWPEMAIPVAKEDEAALIARGQQVATQEGIYLAMSYYTSFSDDQAGENKIAIVDPNGEVVLEHLKFGGAAQEGWQPGDGVLKTVETPYGTLSGAVCADATFPLPMRQAGRNDTDILLVGYLEWRALDPLSAQLAVFRAIENGVSLVRVADNGLSLVSDPYGRILAATNHFRADERTIVAQVPTRGVFTLYSVIGDAFAWLCGAGLVALIVWGIVRGRRAKRANAS